MASKSAANGAYEYATRLYSTRRLCNRRNLFARISPLGDPDLSLIPVLDHWIHEGRKIKGFELHRIIRDLRTARRFGHALEVSEWMISKGLCSPSPRDYAVQLDLIGQVRGLKSAETFFNSIADKEKFYQIYGALLNCYVREGHVEMALSHMDKMKKMGFGSLILNYNNIMCLYLRTGQLEKIPEVFSEMKENGVLPDNYSYRICISSYGARWDLKSVERVLEEMENQPRISMEWRTYSMVASFYIKASIHEKALFYLKKCEDKINQDALGYNNLISHYASLKNKSEMMRLWGVLKGKCGKLINRDYITMLGSLVKLDELDVAESLVKEWESSFKCYDFRVPNILLIGYSRKGSIKKAEMMVKDTVNRGRIPTPNSWAIIASGYLEKEKMEKAYECMKKALDVQAQNKGWRPKPGVISSITKWLAERGRDEELDEFLSLSKTVSSSLNKEKEDASMVENTGNGKEDGSSESTQVDDLYVGERLRLWSQSEGKNRTYLG